MVSDSISDFCLFSGSSNSRDLAAKKKRANWSTKLKQWRLGARRKQWVSDLVTKKGGHEGEDNGGTPKAVDDNRTKREKDFPFASLKVGWDEEQIDDAFTHNESDLDSSAGSSPTSVLTSKDSGSMSHDAFCCSGQIEEEEEDVFDDAFDNWEGFADALSFFEKEDSSSDSSENEGESPSLEAKNSEQESSSKHPDETRRDRSTDKAICRGRSSLQETGNSEQESSSLPPDETRSERSTDKAIYWGKSLLQETKNAGQGSSESRPNMTQQNKPPEPGPCPICFEDMDATDLSFLPCPCGFRLCLFCHKTIVEGDGRCPGCRKVYETGHSSSEVSFQQRGGGTLHLSPSFRGLDRA